MCSAVNIFPCLSGPNHVRQCTEETLSKCWNLFLKVCEVCPTCSMSKTCDGTLCIPIYSQVCKNKDKGFCTVLPSAITYLYLHYFANLSNYCVDPITFAQCKLQPISRQLILGCTVLEPAGP